MPSWSSFVTCLLRDDVFLSPARETAVTLDGETVATVAAAEASNAGAEATE